jgi:hypothetical protein
MTFSVIIENLKEVTQPGCPDKWAAGKTAKTCSDFS